MTTKIELDNRIVQYKSISGIKSSGASNDKFKNLVNTPSVNEPTLISNINFIDLDEPRKRKKREIIDKSKLAISKIKEFHKNIISGSDDMKMLSEAKDIISGLDLYNIDDEELLVLIKKLEVLIEVEMTKKQKFK